MSKHAPAPERAPGALAGIMHRNIRALADVRREAERVRTPQHRFADTVARFTGSFPFVAVHAVLFAAWVGINTGKLGLTAFDPYPFTLLGTLASMEAIFLTTFVLISQNRNHWLSDNRANLDLQVNLLAEHELTHLVTLMEAVADHLGVKHGMAEKLEDLKTEVAPETVMREVQRANDEVPDP